VLPSNNQITNLSVGILWMLGPLAWASLHACHDVPCVQVIKSDADGTVASARHGMPSDQAAIPQSTKS